MDLHYLNDKGDSKSFLSELVKTKTRSEYDIPVLLWLNTRLRKETSQNVKFSS